MQYKTASVIGRNANQGVGLFKKKTKKTQSSQNKHVRKCTTVTYGNQEDSPQHTLANLYSNDNTTCSC